MLYINISEVGVSEAAAESANIIKSGGVIVFPTETVYGMAFALDNPETRRKVIAAKGRDENKPMQVMISKDCDISRFASKVSMQAQKLADTFWPGAMTLVLPASENETVGLRMPDHEFTQALLKECGGAFLATSANLAGTAPITSATQAREIFADSVDCIVDGGTNNNLESSTVVACIDEKYNILRDGVIGMVEIENCLQGIDNGN